MNITFCKPIQNLLLKINITPEYYEQLSALLKIKRVVGKDFVRLGRPNDGGYIMVDNFNVSGGGENSLFFRNKQGCFMGFGHGTTRL